MVYNPWNKGITFRRKNPIVKECLQCGKVVELRPHRIIRFKYCSKQCQYLSMKNHIPWNKNKSWSEEVMKKIKPTMFKKGLIPWNYDETAHNICIECNQPVWRRSIRCKECFTKWKFQIKENHPRYKKDRSSLIISDRKWGQRYREWSSGIKLRDKIKCKIANSNCQGQLEAHHILDWKNYPELRYDINNGITLCHAHHPRGRVLEQELAPILQELVKG